MDREPLEPKPKPENERVEGLEKEDRIAGRDMACKRTTTTERKTNEGAEASMFRLNELMMQTMKLYAAPKVEIDIFYGDPLE